MLGFMKGAVRAMNATIMSAISTWLPTASMLVLA
jgi:hypothetical protein